MIAQTNPAVRTPRAAEADPGPSILPTVRGNFACVFTQEGEFAAYHAAVAWLKARGFSVGTMQSGEITGIMHGECRIGKYRALDAEERIDLHGHIRTPTMIFRSGPVTVELRRDAPWAVQQAFRSEPEDTDAQARIEGRSP